MGEDGRRERVSYGRVEFEIVGDSKPNRSMVLKSAEKNFTPDDVANVLADMVEQRIGIEAVVPVCRAGYTVSLVIMTRPKTTEEDIAAFEP